MSEIQLTPIEHLALTLLRNTPQEIQKITRADGSITIDSLHRYFTALSIKLDTAYAARHNTITDAIVIATIINNDTENGGQEECNGA